MLSRRIVLPICLLKFKGQGFAMLVVLRKKAKDKRWGLSNTFSCQNFLKFFSESATLTTNFAMWYTAGNLPAGLRSYLEVHPLAQIAGKGRALQSEQRQDCDGQRALHVHQVLDDGAVEVRLQGPGRGSPYSSQGQPLTSQHDDVLRQGEEQPQRGLPARLP